MVVARWVGFGIHGKNMTRDQLERGGCFFLACVMEWWKDLNEAERLAALAAMENHVKNSPPTPRLRLE